MINKVAVYVCSMCVVRGGCVCVFRLRWVFLWRSFFCFCSGRANGIFGVTVLHKTKRTRTPSLVHAFKAQGTRENSLSLYPFPFGAQAS